MSLNRKSTGSIFGIDVFRGLAIFLMVITHTQRTYLFGGPKADDQSVGAQALAFFRMIEPFTPAAFLLLVGVGLYLSYQKTQDDSKWLRRMIVKALLLYATGIVIFLTTNGFQYPDVIFAPSILSAIALAIIVTSLCIRRSLYLYLASVAVILVTVWATGHDAISALSGGPGVAFPLIGFSLVGARLSMTFSSPPKESRLWFTALFVVGLVAFFVPGPWITMVTSDYHFYPTGRDLYHQLNGWNLGLSAQPVEMKYWNHTLIGAVRLLAPLTIALYLSWIFSERLKGLAPLRGLALIGRHALGCYVLHLGLLALFIATGFAPASGNEAWIYIIALMVVNYGYARLREA